MPKPSLPHTARTAAALLAGALLFVAAPTTQAAVAAPSAVQVNQLGYLPDGPKRATVVTAEHHRPAVATARRVRRDGRLRHHHHGWRRRRLRRLHPAGGLLLVPGIGTGYTLTVDGRTSHPFDIRAGLYDGLRADAMSFFYQQRSGTPIEARLAGAAYARPAGHLGVAPNQGDTSVPCQPGVCDYARDVRGGWYDAGDQGKYVVNGGIATWQLVNSFERAKRSGHAAALGDSTLRVPERGNKVPDVLDEARWELEFLMRMQIPDGKPLAGMAFHKIHDAAWTGLPTRPEQDSQPRELHPPSTAATLNLAATAAQCARVYAPYDAAFAARCLTSARRAWTAAQAHPDRLAPDSDGTGGGAYGDTRVGDESYWAAAELYATTKESRYRDAVTSSPFHTSDDVFTPAGFAWHDTAALGRITLATVPNGLPATDLTRVRASVVSAADGYLATMGRQGYAVPPAHRRLRLGLQRPSGQQRERHRRRPRTHPATALPHRRAGSPGLPARPQRTRPVLRHRLRRPTALNQHHRFWAHQYDATLPNPPAGSFAGGPNAALQDPVAQEKLAGCKPAKCYIDDIGSYSTNEVAINWNAPLAWLVAFAAER